MHMCPANTLNGAERIISTLLPGRDDETVALRRTLIDEAHQAMIAALHAGWDGRAAT